VNDEDRNVPGGTKNISNNFIFYNYAK